MLLLLSKVTQSHLKGSQKVGSHFTNVTQQDTVTATIKHSAFSCAHTTREDSVQKKNDLSNIPLFFLACLFASHGTLGASMAPPEESN